jgi:hypothetical protein
MRTTIRLCGSPANMLCLSRLWPARVSHLATVNGGKRSNERPSNKDAACINRVQVGQIIKWSFISGSPKLGKAEADNRVERSLYERANGYSYDAVKIFMPAAPRSRCRRPTSEHTPPDVTACIFWMKNPMPEKWRDVQNVDHVLGKYIIIDLRVTEEEWARERATIIDETPVEEYRERRLRAVSCETIYAFIYRAAQRAEPLWRYLARRHKRRRRRSRASQDTIKDRVSIHERMLAVFARIEFLFCKNLLVRPHYEARAWSSAVPTASQSKPQLFRLCQPMTPALPVGERRLRHVPSWAAVRQAAARHCVTTYRHRDQDTRVSEKFSSPQPDKARARLMLLLCPMFMRVTTDIRRGRQTNVRSAPRKMHAESVRAHECVLPRKKLKCAIWHWFQKLFS